MEAKKRWPWYVLISVLVLAAVMVWFPYHHLNDFQKDGVLKLAGLKAPVKVLRDEKGMAYVYAQNLEDAIMAQGFVSAQDRLFQMELNRLFASGRICELAGAAAKSLDIRHRTLGFYRQAQRQANLLSPDARCFFQSYVDGINAYIRNRPKTHHLKFKLAGIRPTPWAIADTLAILYYMNWDTSANVVTEAVTQMLVEKLGPEKAREIFPLNINPDQPPSDEEARPHAAPTLGFDMLADKSLAGYFQHGRIRLGSNNWTVGPSMSAGKKPIVANDPHLDARVLPGPWYPIGLFGPDFRVVGVNIAGIPGIVAGRNTHVAYGVTNAYGDAQDLYVETLDPANPDHYLEGPRSIPFEVTEETLRIKDKTFKASFREEKIQIKSTRRGPVISKVMPGLKTQKVITMRFAPYESMQPEIGLNKILYAKSVYDIRRALKDVGNIILNFVFADTAGNIGWQVSGRMPIRTQGQSIMPFVVRDGRDNWNGWIPFEQMPHSINPAKGWLGTCNHYTVGDDYPYYYTSYASHSYRYRRLKELMAGSGPKSADDLFSFQRDTKNMLARMVVQGDTHWFDNIATKEVVETRDMLFQQAALVVKTELEAKTDDNPDHWLWGDIHQFELVSPIRRKGFGKGLLGGGSHPFPGSGETLYRGMYAFNKPFAVTYSAALRMVADLDDAQKVMAVLPSGVGGRLFGPHATDQTPDYMSGKKRYWWFSDQAIAAHAKNRLELMP